jgi:hypothetical protein
VIAGLLQRAGGWCEPVQKNNLSTFLAGGESRRVVSFIVRLRGSEASGQYGWQRGSTVFRPICTKCRDGRLFAL